MSITEKLTDSLKQQKVRSWNDLALPSERPDYVNYGLQAIYDLGQDAVPFFKDSLDVFHKDPTVDDHIRGNRDDSFTEHVLSEHEKPTFTGFVRHLLKLNPNDFYSITPIEEADFAYIENGQIRYTQKDKSKLGEGDQRVDVSWRDGNFRIDEIYYGGGFPHNTKVTLAQRTRTAEFITTDQSLRIEVIQDNNGKIRFRIDEYNDERKKKGYGFCGAVEVELEKGCVEYNRVFSAMQVSPELFADPRNTLELFQGINAHFRSNVYNGFKDGKYGEEYKDSLTEKVIKHNLTFEDAVRIAFPKLLGDK